jgi:hypothetical protein
MIYFFGAKARARDRVADAGIHGGFARILAAHFLEAAVEQSQRLRDGVGGFPAVERALLDFTRQVLQNRIGDRFVAGRHADFRKLHLAQKAAPARGFARPRAT